MLESLFDRMKKYENASQTNLTPRMPVIVRVDGKAFHTFTKGMDLFDEKLRQHMISACFKLIAATSANIVYQQSDEISVLLTDYEKFATQPVFGKNLQKLVSITASAATAGFNKPSPDVAVPYKHAALFDSRAFCIPKEEVCNYFICRQRDAIRNSILATAQYYIGKKKCLDKSCTELVEELKSKGINWDDLPVHDQRGCCVKKAPPGGDGLSGYRVDFEIPLFGDNREYIERFVYGIVEEE